MKYLTVNKKIKVIECENMEFQGKDIITISNWDNFLSLLTDNDIIYKIRCAYYIIATDAAWLYTDLKNEVKLHEKD
jgi:hypothetical protein